MNVHGFEIQFVGRGLLGPTSQAGCFCHTCTSGGMLTPVSHPGSSRHAVGGCTPNMSMAIRLCLPSDPEGSATDPDRCSSRVSTLGPAHPARSPLSVAGTQGGQPLAPHSGNFQETMTVTAALAFPDKRYIWCDSWLDFRPGSYILSGKHILSNCQTAHPP